ncbi:hypothetical protein V5F59_10870 [Xanthobacter autotrophicus DSM 431]|uniref:hypothetical protein n=1 Tax=Xanthobacter nonsaccharivorans TaxID=3119912 RepID=UPI00372B78A4
MKQIAVIAVLFSACASPALADQATADKCAANLDADAKAIYVATAPGFASASDPRGLVADKTKALVISGAVPRGTARAAAEAAGTCLTKLK